MPTTAASVSFMVGFCPPLPDSSSDWPCMVCMATYLPSVFRISPTGHGEIGKNGRERERTRRFPH